MNQSQLPRCVQEYGINNYPCGAPAAFVDPIAVALDGRAECYCNSHRAVSDTPLWCGPRHETPRAT